MAAVRARNIVILCDGTGKNGDHDSKRSEPVTNIWRLYNAIQRIDDDVVEYFPGVGADNEKATTSDLLARTFGHTAVHSIRKIYMTIAQNYKDGDCVSLFGYSRGAFIVRKVASLIGALGLITNEAEFNKYWKSMEHRLPGKRNTPRPTNPRLIPISCVGVWDTVGAVRPLIIRQTLNLLTIPDDDLPDIVESALHAVAYHENRKLFDVVLFNGQNSEKQLCKQTCFPGAHADVGGGGGHENTLPDVSLDWMMRNMPASINRLSLSLKADVSANHPLLSAFHSSPAWKRIPDALFRREYLPAIDGLHRHRTLNALASPDSPYLLSHDWVLDEDWDVEEVPNVAPQKKSVMRRLTEMVRSNTIKSTTRAAPAPVIIPAVPQMPSIPSSTEPEPMRRPIGLHTRPDSESTQQTDTTTDEAADTASTPRTSILSLDLEPTIQEECKDEPAGEPEPEHEPELAVEKNDPVPVPVMPQPEPIVEKVEPKPVADAEPISEKPKPEPEKAAPPAPVSNPVAKPKKGIIRRIKGFFRKTLCAGR